MASKQGYQHIAIDEEDHQALQDLCEDAGILNDAGNPSPSEFVRLMVKLTASDIEEIIDQFALEVDA